MSTVMPMISEYAVCNVHFDVPDSQQGVSCPLCYAYMD